MILALLVPAHVLRVDAIAGRQSGDPATLLGSQIWAWVWGRGATMLLGSREQAMQNIGEREHS
jgi:hypothetical protein